MIKGIFIGIAILFVLTIVFLAVCVCIAAGHASGAEDNKMDARP